MRQPAAFLAHGSPTLALDGGAWACALSSFAQTLHPATVLVISAHWESLLPARISSSPHPGVMHDFGGFPEELYGLDYPAPGDPLVAARLAKVLGADLDPTRPLDHGAWVPLRWMFPGAELPVLQLSLPRPRDPALLRRMGAQLRSFRDEGVLILGSGGLVHNLRRLDWSGASPSPESWAQGFEDWLMPFLEARGADALDAQLPQAPGLSLAVPTTEHFDPLWVVLGALWPEESPRDLYRGWQMGSLSLRSLVWGWTPGTFPPPAL